MTTTGAKAARIPAFVETGEAAFLPGERPGDRAFMRQALAMGARHLGMTAPNPSVGAVLVDEAASPPIILARAATAPGGRPHAERLAIDIAGVRARGATLFVTLEPCAHHGRTPPCAEAVIAAGISRVVCGMTDPDPRVAGKGLAMLRAAGIDVILGVLEDAARALHAGHAMRVTAGRPSVTLKLAMTSDGFAASADGSRLRITGQVADRQVHGLRARSDAVLVGVGTVLADDPQLTCRLPGLESRSPIRVVLDTHLRTPLTAGLVTTARLVTTWIIASVDAPEPARTALQQAGVEVIEARLGRHGRIDISEALQTLGRRGVTLLMCEGGPCVADSLAEGRMVDELITITSPHLLGRRGMPAIGSHLAALLSGKALENKEKFVFGEDIWNRYAAVRCSPAS